MKLHVFGSSAGTEPLPGRHHTSLGFEIGDKLYIFDAGEHCSFAATMMGVDLIKTRAVFLSHPHVDHVGGLVDLFWVINKLMIVNNRDDVFDIKLFQPAPEIWQGAELLLRGGGENWNGTYTVCPSLIKDGLLYSDGQVTVEARRNHHIEAPGSEIFHSFSFRIKAEGKTIVFSGDVRKYTDMGDWLDDCDLLLMETGHHKASEVCAGLRADNCGVKDIIFVHSGRELLNDYDGALSRAEAAWGGKLRAALDASTFEI